MRKSGKNLQLKLRKFLMNNGNNLLMNPMRNKVELLRGKKERNPKPRQNLNQNQSLSQRKNLLRSRKKEKAKRRVLKIH